MFSEIDSNNVIERYNLYWRLIGLAHVNPSIYVRAYNVFMIIVIAIYYPIHLIIGLLLISDPKDVFSNLMINVACLACSIKHFFYYPQLERMKDISRLMRELDKHVLVKEDLDFHRKNIRIPTERILYMFAISYQFVWLSSLLMWLMMQQPALVYPAWFPFDWKASFWTHMGAVVFQLVGLELQILMNIANDTYVPLGVCLLSGHTRLLAKRLARLGFDKEKSEKDHYADLIQCADDFKRLKRFFFQLQETISWNMVLQSVTNGVNFCVSVIFVVFYAEDIFEYCFAAVLLIAISIEFYPSCYYGSCVEQNFHDLTYAMFSCDWQNRSPAFRRSLGILIEFSLQSATLYGRSMVKIHLDTYFATMRLSYSLFCLVLNMK